MKLPKIILLSLIFACIGITTEVVFTSISSVATALFEMTPVNWALTGKTYIWMFFIYALTPFLFKLFYPFFGHFSLIIKAFIAVLVIYIIEFASGALLELTIGQCPWKYTEGFHLMGFIRLDYFPFWFVFAVLIVSIYELLDERIK